MCGNIGFHFVYQRDIENNYKDRRRTNENMCKEICLEEIRELYRPIQEKQRRGHYAKSGGFNEYEKDMKQMRDQCERNLGHLGRKVRLNAAIIHANL